MEADNQLASIFFDENCFHSSVFIKSVFVQTNIKYVNKNNNIILGLHLL